MLLYILHVNDVLIYFTRWQKDIMLNDNVVQLDDHVGYYLNDCVVIRLNDSVVEFKRSW